MGFTRPEVLVAFAVALVSLLVFLVDQARNAHPMMPLSLFRSRTVVACLAAGFALNIGFYGLTFLLSLYFQNLRGLSALATGFAFLPMTLVTAVVSFLSTPVVRTLGAKRVMLAGQVLMAAGLVLLCVRSSDAPIWLVALLMMPVSCGGALVAGTGGFFTGMRTSLVAGAALLVATTVIGLLRPARQ